MTPDGSFFAEDNKDTFHDGRDEESIQQRPFAESCGLLGFDRQRARMG